MIASENLREIPYQEYQIVSELAQAHYREHQGRLVAVIAFGDLLTTGRTFDIDLLEVVEDWQSPPRLATYGSSASLPLRGRLRIYFVSPAELRDSAVIGDPDDRAWVGELLRRVRQGYEVILERPAGAVRTALEGQDSLLETPPPASGSVVLSDPFRLPGAKG